MFDQVLWFATRGAGAVALLMFTASTALGLVTVARFQAAGWPRFFNYEMHRRVSLLSVAFLATHVLAAVFDPFTKLGPLLAANSDLTSRRCHEAPSSASPIEARSSQRVHSPGTSYSTREGCSCPLDGIGGTAREPGCRENNARILNDC